MLEMAIRKRSIRGILGAVALGLLAASCGADDANTPSCEGAACDGAPRPWYDESLDEDTSYLPMGQEAFSRTTFSWDADGARADVDVYYPEKGSAPVAIMLPGVAITADRYTWFGSVLASHGVAVAVVGRSGQFSSSTHTTATIAELGARSADASSPLYGKLDLSRLILAGHSQGAFVQAALTNVATCPAGFCTKDAATPDGIRGLILMGFHMETGDDVAKLPIPAIEAPWLMLGGEVDGLSTRPECSATFARLQDRPLYDVTIKGMNHYQFTDYVNPKEDISLSSDNTPTIPNKDARARAAEYAVRFVARHLLGDTTIADDLGASEDPAVIGVAKAPLLTEPGGSGLPRVASEPFGMPGLDGDAGNVDVVATAAYQGATYLLVRNDTEGAAVWRLKSGALEQVPFPEGAKHGVYGNKLLNSLLGSMVVFQDKLWIGFSSGVQGATRGSTGAEVWTYDGAAWEPIVSSRADQDPEAVIAAIDGCDDDDGEVTARITVTGVTMTPGQWANGVADDVDAGGNTPHVFDIVDNTATTLTVALNTKASIEEFATCEGLAAGSKLKLRIGLDESGFGQPWNKAITGMAVLGDQLLVGTGLNLDQGAEVYSTVDGKTFTVAIPRSAFGVHPNGHPISSSIATLHTSNVSGEELAYVAGTGTEEYGARVGVLDAAGEFRFIIDSAVDADATGLDESGMGHANYQVPSMTTFGGRLWLAAFNYKGFELLSLTDPYDKSTFKVEVGQGTSLGPGFGSETQLTAYLSVVGDTLWASTVDLMLTEVELKDRSGAAFRTKDGAAWGLATAHCFGVNCISLSRVFAQDGVTYAVASRASLNSKLNFGPLRMYALRDERAVP